MVSQGSITYRQKSGSFGGTHKYLKKIYRQGGNMALTDTFVKNVKHLATKAGEKYRDGGG